MAASDPDRPDQTLADFVGILISPVLVMTLVGSLVLFLLEVCYSGGYVERMRWTLSFYVFGIVLVCRISMLPDISDRSGVYGVFLAGLTWLCLQAFVEYPEDSVVRQLAPVINLGLITVVWWSAGKLVRDCTNVDEDADMSGEGLLQASGLEQKADEAKDRPRPGEEKTSATGLVAWWERYQRYRTRQERKRTLGVWVVYFSLAALPLFGLGQSLIPPDDVERRRTTFALLAVYVASGLGLLLTTCFLGLRRYLRQRRLQMPAAMTAAWLTFGTVLIVVLLAVCAVIPRPNAEYALINLQKLTGGDRSASKSAVKGDSPGKGDGRSGAPSKKTDAESKATGNQGEKDKGQGNDKGDGEQGKGEGKSGKEKGEGKQSSGQDKDQSKGDEAGKDGKQDRSDNSSAKKDERSSQGAKKEGQKQDEASEYRREQSSAANSMFPEVAKFLKWVTFVIAGIVVAVVVAVAVLRFLANFTGWAARLLEAWARFWSHLFGRRGRSDDDAAPAPVHVRARPPRPFSSFHNPFRLGQPWTPYEFACYTFAAYEARCRELGVPRQPGETPLEHADRVGAEVPALEVHARRLALVYARGLYGSAELPTAVNDVLREVWDRLEAGVEQPLSA